jgi:hypothetical protein
MHPQPSHMPAWWLDEMALRQLVSRYVVDEQVTIYLVLHGTRVTVSSRVKLRSKLVWVHIHVYVRYREV